MNYLIPLKIYYTVYITTNLINNKIYVGVHKTHYPNDGYLGSGKRLQLAINKYGYENFAKFVYAVFDNAQEAFELEAKLVNKNFIRCKNVYNLKCGGDGGFDYCNSPEINKRKSEGLKGKPKSEDHRKHISEANRNNPNRFWSDSFREKMKAIHGSEEYKAKMSAALKGKKRSPETIQRIKESRKNLPPASPETRKKISDALKGRIITAEHRQKISDANRGKKASEETKAKLRASWASGNRKPISDETRKKHGEYVKGRIFLKNEELKINRLVLPDSNEYFDLLEQGYVRGKLQGHK